MKSIVIKQNDLNKRIDKFLKKMFKNLSLVFIYKLLRNKKIKVNNKKVEPDYLLQLNDQIDIYLNDDLLTNDIKKDFLSINKTIDIVYEDENIIIVNKPVGLVVHEDENNSTSDTLLNRIKKYLHDKGSYDYLNENQFAPTLINRIDRNTCGIVIAAKNLQALQILNEKIKNHEIKKNYYALVHGLFDKKSQRIEAYLTRDLNNKIVKITPVPINDQSKEIITEFKVIKEVNQCSWLDINLITGRTHQIRAHFNYINHPLVGEKKYTNKFFSKDKSKNQKLIAYKIKFAFKEDGGILNYLNNKTFIIKTDHFFKQ